MKFKNQFTKNITFLCLCFYFLNIILSSSSAPKVNIYKNEKKIKHSLFREKDSIQRMSTSQQGVPEPKK